MISVENFCEYVGLCNFNDKRRGYADLVDLEQVNKWGLALRGKIKFHSMYHIRDLYTSWTFGEDITYVSVDDDFSELSQYDSDLIIKLLKVTGGKMSLCGGAILNHMYRSQIVTQRDPADYDFFFHCESVQEADTLLKLCMKTIADHCENDGNYFRCSRSEGVQTVSIDRIFKLQFIRRNYHDKSQVLLGFDLPCCQYGYNLIDGFFTTIPGAMAFATGMFPLDITQRSLSFGFRLKKYLRKGFTILLPGLNSFKGNIETPDGILSLNYDSGRDSGQNKYRLGFKLFSNKRIYTNPDHNGDQPLVSDYEGKPILNWYYLACDKYYNVTFYASDWTELYEMSEDQIHTSIFGQTIFDKVTDFSKISLSTMAIFLQDDFGSFYKALRLRNNKLTHEIWKSKLDFYHNKALEIYINLNIPENSWRYKNPGGQDFGKFNPLITNPREWYGPDYKPVIIGISSERLSAFLNVCRHTGFLIPTEILKILCDWWIIAEVTDAKNALLAINYIEVYKPSSPKNIETEITEIAEITGIENDTQLPVVTGCRVKLHQPAFPTQTNNKHSLKIAKFDSFDTQSAFAEPLRRPEAQIPNKYEPLSYSSVTIRSDKYQPPLWALNDSEVTPQSGLQTSNANIRYNDQVQLPLSIPPITKAQHSRIDKPLTLSTILEINEPSSIIIDPELESYPTSVINTGCYPAVNKPHSVMPKINPTLSRPLDRLNNIFNNPIPRIINNTSKNQIPTITNNTSKNQIPTITNNTSKNQMSTITNNTSKNQIPTITNNTSKYQMSTITNNTSKNQMTTIINNTPKNEMPTITNNTSKNQMTTIINNTPKNEMPTITNNTPKNQMTMINNNTPKNEIPMIINNSSKVEIATHINTSLMTSIKNTPVPQLFMLNNNQDSVKMPTLGSITDKIY